MLKMALEGHESWLKALEGDAVDVLRVDSELEVPADTDALLVDGQARELLNSYRGKLPRTAFIVVGTPSSSDEALDWIRNGADEILDSLEPGDFYLKVRLAVERRKQDWNRSLRDGHLYQVEKLESVGRMAAGVAHDVRHLTQIVLGNCSLALRRSSSNPELQVMLNDARSATEKSLHLVDRLLRFIANEPYRGQAYRLDQWLENQKPLIQATNQRKIETLYQLGEERWVQVDPTLVEQVLLNLVINALDAVGRKGSLYLETGGLELQQTFLLQGRCLEAGNYAVLTVTDDGQGVPLDLQSRVFDPFFTTKRDRGGTGLGLSTVLALLNSVGGNLLFQSIDGLGTCARAFLPSLHLPGEMQPQPELVLILDWEPAERLNHRKVLEGMAKTVLEARDVSEARLLLKRHRPSRVLADAHQLAGHADSLRPLIDGCHCTVTSLFPQNWLERKGLIPPGWSYLPKPWDSRHWPLDATRPH